MSSTELINKALEMSSQDRAEMARQLILSLEPADTAADANEAWESEIERRLAKADRGETKLVDYRESVERARRSIRKDDPR